MAAGVRGGQEHIKSMQIMRSQLAGTLQLDMTASACDHEARECRFCRFIYKI